MDDALRTIQRRCPGGFYYKDLTATPLTTAPWDTFAQAQDPLAFKVRTPQLSEVLQSLVAVGVGVGSPCEVLVEGETIAGTIKDIKTRLRNRKASPVYLLILEVA